MVYLFITNNSFFRVFIFTYLWGIFLWMPLYGKTTTNYLKEIANFELPHPVTALSISADEALIAVAMEYSDEDGIVQLHERQSTKKVATIHIDDNHIHKMDFDTHQQRLALAGNNGIQVWTLDNIPIQPEKPLTNDYLLWSYSVEETPQINFSHKSEKLRWIEGTKLQEMDLKRTPRTINSVWIGKESKQNLKHFSYDRKEEWLALNFNNVNYIRLINPGQKRSRPSLDYHFFPVMNVDFINSNVVLSLDTERHLIWGHAASRVKVHGPILESISTTEITLEVKPIFKDRLLIILTQDKETRAVFAHVIDKKGQEFEKIHLINPHSYAVSHTGAYIAAAKSPLIVSIYQSSLFQAPEEYINQLNKAGAIETSRRYRNYLEKIPSQLELPSQKKKNTAVQSLLDNLRAAELAEQWVEMKSWVEEILRIDPLHPEALKALDRLKQHQDLIFLHEGKRALEESKIDEGIQYLIQIPQGSEYYEEARKLINQAEQKNQIALKLDNAQQQMKLKNWAGAKVLVNYVLEIEPENEKAQMLLEEIETFDNLDSAKNITLILGVLIIFGVIGFFLYNKKDQLVSWLMDDTNKTNSSLKPPLRSRSTSINSDAPGQKYFFQTLTKTQEMLRLAQEADTEKKHTGRLLDFEAEINVIRKKASVPEADFKNLTSQLLVLTQTIRNLNFKSEGKKKQNTQHKVNGKNSDASGDSEVDYYNLLGISPEATTQEIKKAYHKKMKEYHPDRHQSSEFDWVKSQAETMTRQLKDAYDVLSDPESRQNYDRSRK